ncbi:MAG: hypothetical protein HND47_23365 [Chloroflexi bacterium]|nr:hypothetical protein [Chloroflexota bacterium]
MHPHPKPSMRLRKSFTTSSRIFATSTRASCPGNTSNRRRWRKADSARGTVTRFQMSLLGQTQNFRTRITEPEPGRVLVETDINTGTPTTFTVSPLTGEARTQVTISTELKNRGAVEAFIANWMLSKVYRAELELLAQLAEEQTMTKPASVKTI